VLNFTSVLYWKGRGVVPPLFICCWRYISDSRSVHFNVNFATLRNYPPDSIIILCGASCFTFQSIVWKWWNIKEFSVKMEMDLSDIFILCEKHRKVPGDAVLISIFILCLSVMKSKRCTFHSILLRIKDLYMFRALLPHPQEALHKRHMVYCVRIMSQLQFHCNRGTAIWHYTDAIHQMPRHMPHTYNSFRFYHPHYNGRGVQIMKLLIM
jgi:hypothetical protein